MRKIATWCIALAAATLQAGTCLAQKPEPSKFYKLDFVIKEVDAGKVLNARSYSVTVNHSGGSIRAGSKVPIPMTPNSSQLTFLDLGVSIDCNMVTETENGASLFVTADISSILQESAPPTYPVIRQNKWTSNVTVPLKKATTLFSSDDATSKRQMQLELTVTPIP
jgi:hypothetical protein